MQRPLRDLCPLPQLGDILVLPASVRAPAPPSHARRLHKGHKAPPACLKNASTCEARRTAEDPRPPRIPTLHCSGSRRPRGPAGSFGRRCCRNAAADGRCCWICSSRSKKTETQLGVAQLLPPGARRASHPPPKCQILVASSCTEHVDATLTVLAFPRGSRGGERGRRGIRTGVVRRY